MKFRFCGGGDCPDWVLAEIISSLSVLSAANLWTLASIVAKKIVGQEFEEETIKSITSNLDDDGKSSVACIHFLVVSAARHNVDESVFDEELQQLGLPKEHAASMCRILTEFALAIREKLVAMSLKVNELISVHCKPATDAPDCLELELRISQELVNGLPQDTTHIVNIDKANFAALLHDMKEAHSIMEKYDFENRWNEF